MKILITGGSGFVGSHLIQELLTRKEELFALSRRPKLNTPYSSLMWDPTSTKLPTQIIDDVDVVIHLAGEPIADKRWTEKQKQKIYESRVNSTRNLATAFQNKKNKVSLFICASAIGIYGTDPNKLFSEESPSGNDFLAQVCSDWEKEASKFPAERIAMVRTGIVLGKDGGMLKKILPVFKFGLGGNISDGTQWMSWIHIDDLVQLIVHIIDSDLSGPVNAVSPHPVTNREFTKRLGNSLKRPALIPVPKFGLKALFGELSETIAGSQRVSAGKALSSNFQFRFPKIEDAFNNILSS